MSSSTTYTSRSNYIAMAPPSRSRNTNNLVRDSHTHQTSAPIAGTSYQFGTMEEAVISEIDPLDIQVEPIPEGRCLSFSSKEKAMLTAFCTLATFATTVYLILDLDYQLIDSRVAQDHLNSSSSFTQDGEQCFHYTDNSSAVECFSVDHNRRVYIGFISAMVIGLSMTAACAVKAYRYFRRA